MAHAPGAVPPAPADDHEFQDAEEDPDHGEPVQADPPEPVQAAPPEPVQAAAPEPV